MLHSATLPHYRSDLYKSAWVHRVVGVCGSELCAQGYLAGSHLAIHLLITQANDHAWLQTDNEKSTCSWHGRRRRCGKCLICPSATALDFSRVRNCSHPKAGAVAPWAEGLPQMHSPGFCPHRHTRPAVVEVWHTCDASFWAAKAGGSGVQGHPCLHRS